MIILSIITFSYSLSLLVDSATDIPLADNQGQALVHQEPEPVISEWAPKHEINLNVYELAMEGTSTKYVREWTPDSNPNWRCTMVDSESPTCYPIGQ